MLRYGCNLVIGFKPFPLATLFINTTGSFMIGVAVAYALKNETFAANWRLFLATGICGGFTTFSSFSLQTLDLLRAGAWGAALWNVGLSVALCLLAVWAGHLVAERLL